MKLRPVISLALGIGAVALLVYFVSPNHDPQALVNEAETIPLSAIAIFVGATLGFHFLRAVRWRLLLKALMNAPEFSTVFWTNMIGYEVNMIIPVRFGGELTRAYIIDAKKGVGFFPSLSTVAVERILDLLSIAALGLLGSFTYTVVLGQFSLMIILIVTGVIAASLFGVVLVGSRNLPLTMRGFRWLAYNVPLREGWRVKILNVIESSLVGATAIGRDTRLLAVSVTLSVGIWLASFISFYGILIGGGFIAPVMAILLGIMLFQLSFILPTAPGNVGTFEGFLIFSFALVGISGQNTSLLAVGLVSHALNALVVTLLGTAGIGLLGLKMGEVFRIPGMKRKGVNRSGPPASPASNQPTTPQPPSTMPTGTPVS